MLKGAGGASGLLKGAGVLAAAGVRLACSAQGSFTFAARWCTSRALFVSCCGHAGWWTTKTGHDSEMSLSCQCRTRAELPWRC